MLQIQLWQPLVTLLGLLPWCLEIVVAAVFKTAAASRVLQCGFM
jgi:hypothetical protein